MAEDKDYYTKLIWKEVSELGLISSTYEEWLPRFKENKEIQKSVHNLFLSDTERYVGVSEDFHSFVKGELGERGILYTDPTKKEVADAVGSDFGYIGRGMEENAVDFLDNYYQSQGLNVSFSERGMGNEIQMIINGKEVGKSIMLTKGG